MESGAITSVKDSVPSVVLHVAVLKRSYTRQLFLAIRP
jgi:hypothetical protein